MHISSVNPKTAANLAIADLDSDDYHQGIKKAAQILVDKGFGHFVYQTSWSSGNTFWLSGARSYVVEKETGHIRK